MFPAIKTQFFSAFVDSGFIDFLLDSHLGRRLVFYCCSVLIRALKERSQGAYLRASASVSWSCKSFLLTLFDLPFVIMAINIFVSNHPAGKSPGVRFSDLPINFVSN